MQLILNAFAILFGGGAVLAATAWWPTDEAARALGVAAYVPSIASLFSGFGMAVLFVGISEALDRLDAVLKAITPKRSAFGLGEPAADLPVSGGPIRSRTGPEPDAS